MKPPGELIKEWSFAQEVSYDEAEFFLNETVICPKSFWEYADIRGRVRGIPAQNFVFGTQVPGKTSICARISMTLAPGRATTL